ncbi:four helix bundle protein [Dysgonomonas sp. 511]|uniref:four helix bundle protein n=1 Tax=Dysgonomonas sp. 511 TaxID=2302930 RepID=UPI0013D13589|nr:four helix bundle protein [Dysgonomonas sp. 511]NDV79639.1 four helix bundle protein [Dysgonomonas sp. 511]
MGTHKDLTVWQKSIHLVKMIYVETKSFPKEELFGLISQMRRSAVSIPSNIAEGFGRGSKKECEHFVYIALGSASELETQLIIAKELDYFSGDKFNTLNMILTEIIKMLSALINSMKK